MDRERKNREMSEFELRIETDTEQKTARLKLFGADGSHVGSNEIRLPEHSSALWEGLFDTRRFIERYEGGMIFDDQSAATVRMLLGIVTVANEPVSEGFIDGVWQGKSVEDEQLHDRPSWLNVPLIGPLLAELRGSGLKSQIPPTVFSRNGRGASTCSRRTNRSSGS